jgi:serine protease
LAAPTASALTTVAGTDIDTAQVIVKFRAYSPVLAAGTGDAAATDARARALGRRLGLSLQGGAALSPRSQVIVGNRITTAALLAQLAQQSDIEYAVADRIQRRAAAPNDPRYGSGVPGSGPAVGQWYLRAPEGNARSGIDAEPAWDVTTGSPAVVVAVLDTGIRFEHPDLRAVAAGGNLLAGYDMVADVTRGNDGDGRDGDPSDPGDWVTAAELATVGSPLYHCAERAEDSSWHGTQTAGLIGALTNNGVGMASVGRTVRILPVRVLGKCGEGMTSDIIAGMRWAAGLMVPGVPANPDRAQVINMSLGGEGTCSLDYEDAIREIVAAGTSVIASAGNSSGHAVSEPANCSGVIAVAALRHVGTKVGFSDLGPEITVSAPGGNCVNTAAGTPCLYPILTTSNTGPTTPVDSTYTDSFNPSLGTSFSAPLVAGTAALMLAVQPALSPAALKEILRATARPFPTSSADSTTPVAQCTLPRYDAAGAPVDQFECVCTTSTCGAGMLDAGAAVRAASAGPPLPDVQAQGLWWNAPGGSESGWGINFAHQGDVIFATWYTYDATGKAWWLSMTANRIAPNVYTGTLVQTRGPAFSAVPFNASAVTSAPVGTATVSFIDNDNATFAYAVNGIAQSKSITRQVFGTLPTCTFALHPGLAYATNFQDLWWNAPAGSESGWGINLTMQSNVIFATWFTYDIDGSPLWLSATAPATGPGAYAGTLYRTTGPAFSAVPFNPGAVKLTAVGNLALTFADGNAATFAYTVNGVAQSKSITRQVFRTPGTACQS